MRESRISLKARLTLLVLLAVGAVWMATVVQTWRQARHEIDEVLDAHLAQAASFIVAQTSHELEEVDTEHAPPLHKYARKTAFQIWERGTRLRLHSANAPNEPLGTGEAGFSDRVVDGRRWRVFSSWNEEGNLLIHVGESAEVRDELQGELAAHLLKPLLIALPVLGALLWWAVGGGLRPLRSLADEVARRAPERLEALPIESTPAELRPLVGRLNALFARVARSLENERNFTADAAHELRTPLAAIRAQAQVALGSDDETQRRATLAKVIAGCDRATHLVEQMLTLARLDRAMTDKFVPVALRALAAEVVAELAPHAVGKHVDLSLAEGKEASVPGNTGLLRILLRNLIDNAIRYTPPEGCVVVRVARENGRTALVVSDDGPGIPEEERQRVMDRFHRIAGSGEDGSGLGLPIAARIAAIHGASISLGAGEEGKGLTVTVGFPL